MKAGAIEFLTKPFQDEELLNAINQAIERGAEIERLKNEAAREHCSPKTNCAAKQFSESWGRVRRCVSAAGNRHSGPE